MICRSDVMWGAPRGQDGLAWMRTTPAARPHPTWTIDEGGASRPPSSSAIDEGGASRPPSSSAIDEGDASRPPSSSPCGRNANLDEVAADERPGVGSDAAVSPRVLRHEGGKNCRAAVGTVDKQTERAIPGGLPANLMESGDIVVRVTAGATDRFGHVQPSSRGSKRQSRDNQWRYRSSRASARRKGPKIGIFGTSFPQGDCGHYLPMSRRP